MTNGTIADVALVTCKAESNGELYRYVVESSVSDFMVTDFACIGTQQGHLAELTFDRVSAPRAIALMEGGSTMRILTQTWAGNRPLLGLLALRQAVDPKSYAMTHLGERDLFGSALTKRQLVQQTLSNIEAYPVSMTNLSQRIR
ncbi:acyl-CoA dehydrogenase family protein [Paraburkholderia caribensis]|uniref:hypothetical protein n=1 Tax=Paraburkholderia caribensis TaxID=75105 RepID=UPI000721275D|nr:hypothetical protein [Paraburkholderia caribensis]ALP68578.1 hypothetical protein AN416_38340 [Paraburkholderia caribensis]AUT57937.1 hypothetical protein C2L66_39340 [Paraburkholderia caribensis]